MAAKCLWVGSSHRVDTLGKSMTHIPGGTEYGGARFHHATQKSIQFKIFFWNFLFIIFGPQLTQATKIKNQNQGQVGTTIYPITNYNITSQTNLKVKTFGQIQMFHSKKKCLHLDQLY